jgi:hypothetical protein
VVHHNSADRHHFVDKNLIYSGSTVETGSIHNVADPDVDRFLDRARTYLASCEVDNISLQREIEALLAKWPHGVAKQVVAKPSALPACDYLQEAMTLDRAPPTARLADALVELLPRCAGPTIILLTPADLGCHRVSHSRKSLGRAVCIHCTSIRLSKDTSSLLAPHHGVLLVSGLLHVLPAA